MITTGLPALVVCLRPFVNSAASTASTILLATPGGMFALAAAISAHPHWLAMAMAGLGFLRCLWRAWRWWHDRRQARSAVRFAQVDAAARWAISELRAHALRWKSASGLAQPLAPSELRDRLPHSVRPPASARPLHAQVSRRNMTVSPLRCFER